MKEPKGPPQLSRRDLLVAGAGALVGGAGIYAGAIEPEWLETTRVTVPIRDLPGAFEGYRVGVISDLHYPRNITEAFVRRASRQLMAERPDVIVVPGDFADGHTPSSVVPDLSDVFSELDAPDGVWGCLGNHDIALNKQGVIREMRRTPIQVLVNDHVTLRRKGERLILVGVDDLLYGQLDLGKAMWGVPDSVPTVLMCHHPDFAEENPWGLRVDLQVSGHTHGGEVVLPLIGETFLPSRYGAKFREGLVEGAKQRVFVTRGVCSPRHFRFLCRPDVAVITLTQAG